MLRKYKTAKQGIIFPLYYQFFQNSCGIPNFCKKNTSKVNIMFFMQHCFFEACTCLENQRVDVKPLENIYCDCLFWLNCCGFIMVRGLQRIPHFYFQIDCISNIKSKWQTCFSFLTYYILRALQMKIAM